MSDSGSTFPGGYHGNQGGGNHYQSRDNGNGNGGWRGNNGGNNNWRGNNGGGNGGNGGSNNWRDRNGGGGGWKKPGGFNGQKNDGPQDLTIYRAYAVVGNPNPPAPMIDKINRLIPMLDKKGYTLRTGAMDGLEEVAEKLAPSRMEVHLPFKGFKNRESKFTFNTDRTKAIAALANPVYEQLKPGAQSFICKDARLIFGGNSQSTASFLLVWTEDGAESIAECNSKTGFAQTAIRLAGAAGIPIFNLTHQDAEERIAQHLLACSLNTSESGPSTQAPANNDQQQHQQSNHQQHDSQNNGDQGWEVTHF